MILFISFTTQTSPNFLKTTKSYFPTTVRNSDKLIDAIGLYIFTLFVSYTCSCVNVFLSVSSFIAPNFRNLRVFIDRKRSVLYVFISRPEIKILRHSKHTNRGKIDLSYSGWGRGQRSLKLTSIRISFRRIIHFIST